jgi:hypothetical protein
VRVTGRPEAEVPAGYVDTVKFAVVAPDAIVTAAGTDAKSVLSLHKLTTVPPDGAAALNVTVPVVEAPPMTADEVNETDDRKKALAGSTVTNPLFETLPPWPSVTVAVTVLTVGDVTAAGS